jgi:hypothetical protein
MKSIACINTVIPTVDHHIKYISRESLRDYDIAIFDLGFPYVSRIDFTAGGSCISIEGTAALTNAMTHWSNEIRSALQAGKNIFVTLNEHCEDLGANSSTMQNKAQRTYNTFRISNYSILPVNLSFKNAIGKKIIATDSAFKNLLTAIEPIAQYRVVINAGNNFRKIFGAKDGTAVGAILKIDDLPGSLILLPYFDFDIEDHKSWDDEGQANWTDDAIAVSNATIKALIAIDKMVRDGSEISPPPTWLDQIEMPKAETDLAAAIEDIDAQIRSLQLQRNDQLILRGEILEFSHLLYETGKPLEKAVDRALRLLDYSVEMLRVGDLEIDHVIVGPSGKRMIGETEGKDNSAINIGKFRQLESNIGEDFERDEIDIPAKGLLFGNGFRLIHPNDRACQFTDKSLTNSNRLGVSLIQTSDLYSITVHLLNNPDDEQFKTDCRAAIENQAGGVVVFPKP